MATRARFAQLGDRERWFLVQLRGLMRDGKTRTADELNRFGLHLCVCMLRLLGQHAPYAGGLPHVLEARSAGTAEVPESDVSGAERVRLTDDDVAFLELLRARLTDASKWTTSALNVRGLHFGYEVLRHLGLVDRYEPASPFADLVSVPSPSDGSKSAPKAAVDDDSEVGEWTDLRTSKTCKGCDAALDVGVKALWFRISGRFFGLNCCDKGQKLQPFPG